MALLSRQVPPGSSVEAHTPWLFLRCTRSLALFTMHALPGTFDDARTPWHFCRGKCPLALLLRHKLAGSFLWAWAPAYRLAPLLRNRRLLGSNVKPSSDAEGWLRMQRLARPSCCQPRGSCPGASCTGCTSHAAAAQVQAVQAVQATRQQPRCKLYRLYKPCGSSPGTSYTGCTSLAAAAQVQAVQSSAASATAEQQGPSTPTCVSASNVLWLDMACARCSWACAHGAARVCMAKMGCAAF